MLKGFLRDKFAKGLKYYLEKFQYGNAMTDDLWGSLSKVGINFHSNILESLRYDFVANSVLTGRFS